MFRKTISPLALTLLSLLAPSAVANETVSAQLDRLTLPQKAAQVIMGTAVGTEWNHRFARLVRDLKIGGLTYFGYNTKAGARSVAKLSAAIFNASRGSIPPFIAVDHEGGGIVRLRNGVFVPPRGPVLGAMRSIALAREVGRAVGEDLALLGINMNYAPVLDVIAGRAAHRVLGARAMGSDPARVAEIGAAIIRGLQEAGVSSAPKHFPGQGAATVDSHKELPVIDQTLDGLRTRELPPFVAAIAAGADAITTAHISLPRVEGGAEPATLNRRILTDLLRSELKFGGVIISDGLAMKAVSGRFGINEAAVRALAAGADMLAVYWTPEKIRGVRDAIVAAVKSGRIPRERLDDAVRRILAVKEKRGLFTAHPLAPDEAVRRLRDPARIKARKDLLRRIAARE
ncbi:MAG: glycoside hydrolase family 3 protein [Deltaproteobacteria bacterium]|nr:glycoside hydrolase family 3 protein [Deltaproteobacteria bacterium]